MTGVGISRSGWHLLIVAAGAVLACAAAPALAGDDDKAPAYKIYIDPETGRYTTEDPEAAQPAAAVPPPAAAGASKDRLPMLAGGAIVAGLAGFVLFARRRRNANTTQ